MHGHFEDINAIQVALISGNLVEARKLAAQVRLGFSGPAPEGWAPYIERSIASAEMLEVSDDLAMAARLAGTMANTCGDCHRSHDLVVIEHVAIAPPAEEDAFDNFMLQHRWAADRMWEGLIGPSDAAWQAGAKALQSTELSEEDIGERLIVTPAISAILLQIRDDAKAATTTDGAEQRQELYGRFLAGCASCHRDMKNQRD
jgi:cytochrome c553